MAQFVYVTFNESTPAPQGGIRPGVWNFTGGPDNDGNLVLPASNSAYQVTYKLTSNSSQGCTFHAISINDQSAETTYVSETEPTGWEGYSWGQFQVEHIGNDIELRLNILNSLQKGDAEMTLGVVLTLIDNKGQLQTSRDPQIVLRPSTG